MFLNNVKPQKNNTAECWSIKKINFKKIKNLLWQNQNKNWDANSDQWNNE